MKNWVVILFIGLFPAYVFSQNWFVGGSLDVSFQNNRHWPQDEYFNNNIPTSTIIDFSPTIGISLDKFDFGMSTKFGFEYYTTNTAGAEYTGPIVLKFGGGLFTRHNFATFGNFSILGRLGVDYLYQNRMDGHILDSHRVDVKLSPVFQYKLFDHLLLYSNLGIDGIYYTFVYLPNYADSINRFGISIPSFFSLSNLSLGFYFVF